MSKRRKEKALRKEQEKLQQQEENNSEESGSNGFEQEEFNSQKQKLKKQNKFLEDLDDQIQQNTHKKLKLDDTLNEENKLISQDVDNSILDNKQPIIQQNILKCYISQIIDKYSNLYEEKNIIWQQNQNIENQGYSYDCYQCIEDQMDEECEEQDEEHEEQDEEQEEQDEEEQNEDQGVVRKQNIPKKIKKICEICNGKGFILVRDIISNPMNYYDDFICENVIGDLNEETVTKLLIQEKIIISKIVELQSKLTTFYHLKTSQQFRIDIIYELINTFLYQKIQEQDLIQMHQKISEFYDEYNNECFQ